MPDLGGEEEVSNNIPMCKPPNEHHGTEEETIVLERRPSMYFMLQRDTMLLLQLAGMKLKPAQQEWLYWNLLRLLNVLEDEEKRAMTSPYNNGYVHKESKKPSTFDGGGYRIFWDEYNSIEQSHPPSPTVVITDSEDGILSRDDKSEREIQWLSDVGFTNIAKKIRARHEIDQNDDEIKIITASLTRAQANAVCRRIDSLNEAIRHRDASETTPKVPNPKQRRHVKDIFGDNGTSKNKKIHNDSSWIKHEKDGEQLSPPPTVLRKIKKPKSLTSPPAIPPKPVVTTRQIYLASRINQETIRSRDAMTNGSAHHSPMSNNESNISPGSPKEPLNVKNVVSPVTSPTPQVDNLVRRTSANHLINISTEERDIRLSTQCDNTGKQHPENVTQFEFDMSSEKESLVTPCRVSIKKRETFDSSYLRTPNDECAIKSRQAKRSASHHLDLSTNSRKHSDAPVGNQEKRLVVVDSTYINVSSVGDGYTTIKTSVSADKKFDSKKSRSSENLHCPSDGYGVEKNNAKKDKLESVFYSSDDTAPVKIPLTIEDRKKSHRKDKMSESAFYPTDNHSLQPYDMDVLSDNLSDISIRTSSDTTGPRCSSTEPPLTEPDGNVQSYRGSSSASPRRKNRERKHKSKDPEKQHRQKERRKHKHRKNKNDVEKDNDKIPKFDVLITKSETPLSQDTNDVQKSDTSLRLGHSDNSIEMINDIPIVNESKNSNKSPKVIYYSSSDSNRSTPDRGLDFIVSTPRTQSPSCVEDDTKLNTSSTPSPCATQDRPYDPMQGPVFPKLPNVTLSKEELGETRIGDLSDGDMDVCRRIALIELAALFDSCGVAISQRKRKSQMKFKDNGTFGVPLTTLCAREETKQNQRVRIPKIFIKLVDHLIKYGLHEEGLLRIPGSAQRVKVLREEADKHCDLSTFDLQEKKVTDVATCFKQFLRDLPEPLLTHEYQNTFTSVADIPDRKVQMQALNVLVVLLPPVHQQTLKHLLVFLNKVVANEPHNKMGLNNVAMIMAPNLFFQNNAKININEASKAAGMTDVLRMLIKYHKILWSIPSFLVNQLRFINDAGTKTKDPKTLTKIIQRRKFDTHLKAPHRNTGSSGDELEDFEDSLIIRVKAPTLNKQSMAIQLSTQTTVSEVVSKFQWQRQKSNKKYDEIDTSRLRIKQSEEEEGYAGLFLYEVGGNIGERRLDPEACISAILRENPHAEWVLKNEVR